MCDLARTLDLVELVVLGDRLVRREVTTPIRLIQAADDWHGPRRRLLQRAARLVRQGVDSPPESRLRMLVVLAGLPEPTINHIIRNEETGEWLRRFELAYLELLLAIEYQGRWHRESDEVWEGDIERREELDHRTWRVVEVIAKSLNDDPFGSCSGSSRPVGIVARVLRRGSPRSGERSSRASTPHADNPARDDLWHR